LLKKLPEKLIHFNFLSPIVLPQVTSVQTATAACTAAVSACNSLQKNVTSAMQACKQDPSALTSKLKSLTNNLNDATSVANKINSLLGTSGFIKRAPSTTCAGVAADANTYTTTLAANPAATTLPSLAANVINAGTVTCTDADKAALTSVASAIAAQVVAIAQQISTVQANLAGELRPISINQLKTFQGQHNIPTLQMIKHALYCRDMMRYVDLKKIKN
jgi:hypothetical protein